MTDTTDMTRRGLIAAAGAVGAVAAFGTMPGAASAAEAGRGSPALVQLTLPSGALSPVQRQAVIAGVTRVIADVTGTPAVARAYITVLVGEAADGGWGVAGHGYVTAEFPQLMAGHPIQ